MSNKPVIKFSNRIARKKNMGLPEEKINRTIEKSVNDLVRITNHSFGDIQGRFNRIDGHFLEIRTEIKQHATKSNLRETEQHLLDAINGIEVKRREFEDLKSDVEELSQKVVHCGKG